MEKAIGYSLLIWRGSLRGYRPDDSVKPFGFYDPSSSFDLFTRAQQLLGEGLGFKICYAYRGYDQVWPWAENVVRTAASLEGFSYDEEGPFYYFEIFRGFAHGWKTVFISEKKKDLLASIEFFIHKNLEVRLTRGPDPTRTDWWRDFNDVLLIIPLKNFLFF